RQLQLIPPVYASDVPSAQPDAGQLQFVAADVAPQHVSVSLAPCASEVPFALLCAEQPTGQPEFVVFEVAPQTVSVSPAPLDAEQHQVAAVEVVLQPVASDAVDNDCDDVDWLPEMHHSSSFGQMHHILQYHDFVEAVVEVGVVETYWKSANQHV